MAGSAVCTKSDSLYFSLEPKHQDVVAESEDDFTFHNSTTEILTEPLAFEEDANMSEITFTSPEKEQSAVSQSSAPEPQSKPFALRQLLSRPDSSGTDMTAEFRLVPLKANRLGRLIRKPHNAVTYSAHRRLEGQTGFVQATCNEHGVEFNAVESPSPSTNKDAQQEAGVHSSPAQIQCVANALPKDSPANTMDNLCIPTCRDPERVTLQQTSSPDNQVESALDVLRQGQNSPNHHTVETVYSNTADQQDPQKAVSTGSVDRGNEHQPVPTKHLPTDAHSRSTTHESPLCQEEFTHSPHLSLKGHMDCKSPVPSETDLLALLAHRSRQREQDNLLRSERIVHLQRENEELQRLELILRDELKAATAQRDELRDSAEVFHDDLEMFKNKYRKLKNWALEMNSEYAAVRQEGHDLKMDLSDLRQEGTEVRRDVLAATGLSDEAVATIGRVRQSLSSETRTFIQSLDDSLQQARANIAEKNAQIHTLEKAGLERESHIRELQACQTRSDDQTKSRQDHLAGALLKLDDKIESLLPRTKETSDLTQCLELVETVRENGLTTSGKLEAIESSIVQFSEWFEAVRTSIETFPEKQLQIFNPSLLTEQFRSLQNSLQQLKPDVAKIEDLQQENARLLEKSNGDMAIRKLVQEAKVSAEVRQLEVQRNNDKLIDSLTSARQVEETRRSKLASEAETRFNEAIMKWTRAASELADAKARLSVYEVELQKQKDRLEEREIFHTSQSRACVAKHEQATRLLKEESVVEQKRVKADFENQVMLKDLEIDLSAAALQDIKKELDAAKQDKTCLEADKVNLLQQLQSTSQKLDENNKVVGEQKQAYEKLKSQVSELQTELSVAKQCADEAETSRRLCEQRLSEIQSRQAGEGSPVELDQSGVKCIDPSLIMSVANSGHSAVQSLKEPEFFSQTSIVPDSQLVSNVEPHGSLAKPPSQKVVAQSSSPLTEIATDIDVDDEVTVPESNHRQNLDDANDELGAPRLPPRPRHGKTTRASSTLSYDEMLLQSSETGRHSNSRVPNAQHAHPASKTVSSSQTSSENDSLNPHTTGQGQGVETTDVDLNTTSTALRTPSLSHREPVRPNSAIKRQVDHEDHADVHERQIGKKLKLTNVRAGSRVVVDALQVDASSSAPPKRVDELPSGSRSGNAVAESASSTNRKRTSRKAPASRIRSRQDRYTQKFNGSSQS